MVRIDLEEIKKTISKLSDSEKESLFFELSPGLGKALPECESMKKVSFRQFQSKLLKYYCCLFFLILQIKKPARVRIVKRRSGCVTCIIH